jgi:hypothetical protein
MDPETEQQRSELYARAAFGKEVEEFWDSRIGKYLRAHAQAQYTSAIEDFKSADVSNAGELLKIQGRMLLADSFQDWLSLAITEGLRSLSMLQGTEDE